jgi:hypothetical protein
MHIRVSLEKAANARVNADGDEVYTDMSVLTKGPSEFRDISSRLDLGTLEPTAEFIYAYRLFIMSAARANQSRRMFTVWDENLGHYLDQDVTTWHLVEWEHAYHIFYCKKGQIVRFEEVMEPTVPRYFPGAVYGYSSSDCQDHGDFTLRRHPREAYITTTPIASPSHDPHVCRDHLDFGIPGVFKLKIAAFVTLNIYASKIQRQWRVFLAKKKAAKIIWTRWSKSRCDPCK